MTSFKDAIKKSKQGVILCVHVVPGSSQNLFPAGYNNWRKCIEIKVHSEAKNKKANNEVIKTVAEFFKLPVKNIILMSGENNRQKTIFLGNISINMVCSKLEGAFHGL